MRSLQRTLAMRYGLTMLVALVAIALWAFLGVKRTLEQQLDRALQNAAQLMVDVVASGEGLALHQGAEDFSRFSDEVNRLVVTRDASGRILDQNSPLAQVLPLDTAAFQAALAGQQAWANTEFAGRRLRSVYVPGPRTSRAAGGAPPVVQVAASMRPLQAASDSVLLRMMLTALVGALVTGAGAGWLARSALRPVQEIVGQARVMNGQGGTRHITAHSDILELQTLIETLNGMLQRVDLSLRQQRRIIADVGHDLRTPITALRGEVEVALRAARSPAEYQALLASMLEEVDRVAALGEGLIALARLEAGEPPLERQPVELVGLLVERAERLRGRRAGPVTAETPPAPVVAQLDARLLELALDQLLDNVRAHAPPGAAVRLGLARQPGRVRLTVEDAGPGVPDDRLPQLFEPFFRHDPARTRGGSGLGLTLVRSIATLHGGAVEATRGTLGGLSVTLDLPDTPGA